MSDQSTQSSADDRYWGQAKDTVPYTGWTLVDTLVSFVGYALMIAGTLGFIRNWGLDYPEKLNGVNMASGMSMALFGIGLLVVYVVRIRVQLSRRS